MVQLHNDEMGRTKIKKNILRRTTIQLQEGSFVNDFVAKES